ncbi:MAG: bifunctional nuclease family protein [Nitrospirae bacterium]|nr:bifunctional nuclease family protein [Nitrospirota bacterium]
MYLMKVRGLVFDPHTNMYIVILNDETDKEILPIWIGKFEANAICFILEGITPPRPMTHDLTKNVLDTLDVKIISIVINNLKDNTYYAKIHLQARGSEVVIDSRPSDAIALALRASAPIFVAEDVLEKRNSENLDQWLKNLKPEDFGKYMT